MRVKFVRSDDFGDLYVDYYEETRVSIRVHLDGSITFSSPKIEVLNGYLKSERCKTLKQLLPNRIKSKMSHDNN